MKCLSYAFMSNNQGISNELANATSRSSYFLLNSASVLDESHSILYSWAIAFKTFSFDSPDGAFTESFSIICIEDAQFFASVRYLHCDQSILNSEIEKAHVGGSTYCAVDTAVRAQFHSASNKLLSILGGKQITEMH